MAEIDFNITNTGPSSRPNQEQNIRSSGDVDPNIGGNYKSDLTMSPYFEMDQRPRKRRAGVIDSRVDEDSRSESIALSPMYIVYNM